VRVVAVAGAKGGVGKSAAAVNLAMIAARAGFRTLLWDLDPNGAATHCYRAHARVKGGASRLLGGKRGLETYIRRTDERRLDLLPADPSFRVVDTILSTRRRPDRVLSRLLAPLGAVYDVAILDCAPGLGVVTESVLAASDLLLAPIVPSPLALRSLDQVEEFVNEHRSGVPLLAFLSMLDERKVLHRQVVAQVRGDRRFALAAVPASSAVERMGLEQVPAVVASPRNLAAVAYRRLWAEVEDRLDLEPAGRTVIDLTDQPVPAVAAPG
jgi:cellulose biosynthesis protein BcsQ